MRGGWGSFREGQRRFLGLGAAPVFGGFYCHVALLHDANEEFVMVFRIRGKKLAVAWNLSLGKVARLGTALRSHVGDRGMSQFKTREKAIRLPVSMELLVSAGFPPVAF
jgi:hypothetical protein